MERSFIFNEAAIKRIPRFLGIAIILLLCLPYLTFYLGSYNLISSKSDLNGFHGIFLESSLLWSGVIVAVIALLLAFVQYQLTHNTIILVIGLSLFFSGCLNTVDALITANASDYKTVTHINAFLMLLSNNINGFILVLGLFLALNKKKDQPVSVASLLLIFSLIITVIIGVILLIAIPNSLFKEPRLFKNYELITLLIYSLLLCIYPRVYKRHPDIFSDSIFYIGLIQIANSLYFMLLPSYFYYNSLSINFFFKDLSYLVPLLCLIINYIYSYTAVLNTQKRLLIKQKELSYIASHDPLTNLFNRHEFEELLDKSIANGLRHKHLLSLLLIDLDNFKVINDNFGHNQGDELLKEFSSRLSTLIRKGDLFSRIGGDEFTLISPNLKSPSSARQLAERVLNELNSPYTINNKSITVTVSIGISIFPEDGITTEDLLRKADLALYKAKGSGKNTYNFYTDQMSYKQHRESEIESYLRQALKNEEFELYYQPKYHLISKEIVSAEILLRWNNYVLGEVSPEEFIPVAESTGLIVEIGNWLLRKTCEQAMIWSKIYNITPSLSINLSPLQINNSHFFHILEKALRDFKYPPEFMEFEITENLLMENAEEVNQVLNKVTKLGIQLSLDDFGKGYSSLNRLKTLPISTLKIDKDFISDIHHENEKVIIVDIIIKLAQELGMNLVAEGIETPQQLNYLISRNCLIGQGFLLSRPLKAEDYAALAYSPQKRISNKPNV